MVLSLFLVELDVNGQDCNIVLAFTASAEEAVSGRYGDTIRTSDGLFAFKVPNNIDTVYLKLIKEKGCTSKSPTYQFNAVTGGTLYENEGENIGMVINDSSSIKFQGYRSLKLSIDSKKEEANLSFTSEEESFGHFEVRVAKLIDHFELEIDGNPVHPDTPYNLEAIKVGDSIKMELRLTLDNELIEVCDVDLDLKFTGMAVPGNSWKIKMEGETKSIPLRLQAEKADSLQQTGYLKLTHDCFLVNRDPIEVEFKYLIAEDEASVEELFESLFWFFIAFLTVILIVIIRWYFQYLLKKYAIRSLEKHQQDPSKTPKELREHYKSSKSVAIQSFKEELLDFDSKKEVEYEDNTRKIMLEEVIKSLQEKFFNQLYREEELDYVSFLKIKKLKNKLGGSPNGEMEGTQAKPEVIRGGPETSKGMNLEKMNKKTLQNEYRKLFQRNQKQKEQFENKLEQRIKEKEQSFGEERNKHLQDLKKKEDELAKQRLVFQKMEIRYREVAPYSIAMERYFDLTRDIYDFALNQSKRLPSSSIFYPFFDTILYVKGQAKATNPIFNQATKDDFLCQVLKVDNRQKLADIDAQTFFEYYIKGRGFSMLNAIGKLYAYNKMSTSGIPLKEQMINDGVDLEYLGQVYQEINAVLAQEFGVRIYLPHLLKDKFDPDQYDKNNFSYLAKTYNFSGLEDYIIYDVERVGFKSTNGEQRLILRAMVTYKIS